MFRWRIGAFSYLISDHDVCDFGLAVHVFVLLLVGEDGQHKVAWLALALAHQEAARLALFREELLRITPREVPVVPSKQGPQTNTHEAISNEQRYSVLPKTTFSDLF